MAKFFPELREFQISSAMISIGGHVDARRKGREIQDKFPNWKVDVIWIIDAIKCTFMPGGRDLFLKYAVVLVV